MLLKNFSVCKKFSTLKKNSITLKKKACIGKNTIKKFSVRWIVFQCAKFFTHWKIIYRLKKNFTTLKNNVFVTEKKCIKFFTHWKKRNYTLKKILHTEKKLIFFSVIKIFSVCNFFFQCVKYLSHSKKI